MNNREAFEAWYQNSYICYGRAHFHLNSYGEYVDNDIEASWCAWQAALASQAQQPTKTITELKEGLFGWAENIGGLDDALAVFAKRVLQSQAQQESQWISVQERLPEENCHVLVACEGGNVATTFYAIDHSFFDHAHGYKLSRKVHGKYSKHFELARQYGYKITHWMPLPPVPEGE